MQPPTEQYALNRKQPSRPLTVNPNPRIEMMKIGATLLTALLPVLTGTAAAHEPSAHGGGPDLTPTMTAFGQTGDPRRVNRTVRIEMADTMRFAPATLSMRQGDTVRFVIRNSGRVMHELVIGTDKEQQEHAELMRKHPGMEHDEPYMAHVAPGQRGEIVWQFTQAGEFTYACLIAGHFEAGMVGTIKVLPR